jgi:glycerol-3-phosphate O-acyltransferase
MTYNVNNVIHMFALPSLVARFIRIANRTNRKALNTFIDTLYPFIRAEMFLSWEQNELPVRIQAILQGLADSGLISLSGDVIQAPGPESREYSCLFDIGNISEPTLERFYIVIALLRLDAERSPRELESLSSAIAAQLSVLFGLNSPDFFEKSLFSSFLLALKEGGIVDGGEISRQAFDTLAEAIARTVSPDVRHNIHQAVSARNESINESSDRLRRD